MPSEIGALIALSLKHGNGNPIVAMLNDRSARLFAMIEARLGEAAYFAGPEFTVADIMMLFPVSTMRNFVPREFEALKNLQAYLARIGERPANRRAMAKAILKWRPCSARS